MLKPKCFYVSLRDFNVYSSVVNGIHLGRLEIGESFILLEVIADPFYNDVWFLKIIQGSLFGFIVVNEKRMQEDFALWPENKGPCSTKEMAA